MSHIHVMPSARRLMESLRDLGYDFPQAVAELIDNSIDAGATEIDVDLRFRGATSWVRIADNGRGMSADELDEAMRYGSSRTYGSDALGGFGLGLKTASFSQCRSLTVASRRARSGRQTEVRRWDLDAVCKADDWLLEKPSLDEVPPTVTEPLARRSGTVVLWSSLDRILLYKNPDGGYAASALRSLEQSLTIHLAMVFHRFLAGEAGRLLPLTIRVNGAEVSPWDPFARSEPHTEALEESTLVVEVSSGPVLIGVRPFLLPHQHRFSSPEAHQAAAGPRKWNRQQGLYVYRADRLIQSGGWNRLRTQDEHTKLARIAIDLPREADELFGVNVAKMRVAIPDSLRADLRSIAGAVTSRAQDRYRLPRPAGRQATPRSEPEDDGMLQAVLDVGTEFIPRARVVELLRPHLNDNRPLLRKLVNAISLDPWHSEIRGGHGGRATETD